MENGYGFSYERLLKHCLFIITVALLEFSTASTLAARQANDPPPAPPDPQYAWMVSDGPQFVRQTHEPRACDHDYDGKITMNSQAQLCICDGQKNQWKIVGTGAACVW